MGGTHCIWIAKWKSVHSFWILMMGFISSLLDGCNFNCGDIMVTLKVMLGIL